MSGCTLSDGREITVNLNAFTIEEWRGMLFNGLTLEERAERENAVISKAIGWDAEAFANLPYGDWRKASAYFYKVAQEPLADPNSASGSTST